MLHSPVTFYSEYGGVHISFSVVPSETIYSFIEFFFFYCFEKFIWKYWTGIGSVSGLLASVASRISVPHAQCTAETSAWFLPNVAGVCSHPGLPHLYPHFFMGRKRKQACLYCFQKETKREGRHSKGIQARLVLCRDIPYNGSTYIFFFSHNYVLFRWKAQRGNFRRPVPELSECSQNQMSWSLSPRTMDTYTFTLHRWTIRSGWLGKLTVRFHTHRFNQHRWCSSVVLATEKTQIWVDPHASKPFCSRVSCFYMWQVLGEKQPLNSPKPCSVTCCP